MDNYNGNYYQEKNREYVSGQEYDRSANFRDSYPDDGTMNYRNTYPDNERINSRNSYHDNRPQNSWNSYPAGGRPDYPDAYRYGYNINQNPGNGFAIAGLVLGIISILLFWTMPLAMIIAIVGIVLSVVALSKNQSKPLSVAGILTSIVGGILAILTVILILITFAKLDMYDTENYDDDHFAPFPYAEEGENDDPYRGFEDFFDEYLK